MIGFEKIEVISGAGSLSVLSASFIASFGWRSQRHWKKPMHKIERMLGDLWYDDNMIVFQKYGNVSLEINLYCLSLFHSLCLLPIYRTLIVPLLFGTIGNEMNFSDPNFTLDRISKILGIIAICLLVKICLFNLKRYHVIVWVCVCAIIFVFV